MKAASRVTKKRNLETTSTGCPEPAKRSALGDISNAKKKPVTVVIAKRRTRSITRKELEEKQQLENTENVCPASAVTEDEEVPSEGTPFSSPYLSAKESFESSRLPQSHRKSPRLKEKRKETVTETTTEQPDGCALDQIPPGVVDFDKENWLDAFSVSPYVADIFQYYREREVKFQVPKYLEKQINISRSMRAILVDWLVEVQESFELNHESLYLSVKLVDVFLSKTRPVNRDILQLIGATAIFISCKFDERSPPVIDDFLYICDDAYSKKQLLGMEVKILKTVGFDLGMPLSYSFLRRYARCAKLPMDTLTLARYILELSLLEYDLVAISESLIAAAALFLALKMKDNSEWTPTLSYYSGYLTKDIVDLAIRLNAIVIGLKSKNLLTIRNKYSHKVFFEVAKIPPIEF